ncbi:MAG: DUF4293 domain-containing protein [Cyclobacteriaceae bacterium]
MIQRIQTIFLFISAALMIVMLFLPLWQKVDVNVSEVASMSAFQLKYEAFNPDTEERTLITQQQVFYISGVAILSALVSLLSIFQFKNRLRQIQLGALNSFLISATLFVAIFFIFKAEKLLAVQEQGNYLMGFYFPVGSLLCNYMANRFIRKDEKLVRSADRIR